MEGDKLSIKVKIANRVYPVTVLSHEEEGIRRAATYINDIVAQLERNYAGKDKQDYLAMALLKIATRNESLEKQGTILSKQIDQLLLSVDEVLNDSLKIA